MKRIIAGILMLVMCVSMFAACGKQDVEETDDLTAAKDYLYAMLKDKAETTPSDYQVVGVVMVNGVAYDVTWSVEVSAGPADGIKLVPDGKMVTVDVDEKTPEEIVYALKATLTDANGKTASVSFNHKVPAYKESSWAEYAAAASGDTLVVKGVITAMTAKSKGNSSNCIYMQDNDGGYYVYNLSTDPIADEKLEVGMTIRVTGTKDIYSGTYEVMNGAIEIVDSNKTALTPVDYTEKFQKAESLKDEDLTAKQALLVTIKGVEVTGQETGSGYYRFKLGNLESYVRISSSVCPITKDEQTKFIADHAEHFGWIANVTGVICVYDGAFYLTPVSADAFEYVSLPKKSDEEMIAFEKDALTIETSFAEAATLELDKTGKTYGDVAISWASDNAAVAAIDNGKLVVTVPETDTQVKITATLTCNGKKDTKEFTVKVMAPADDMCEAEILGKAFALEQGKSINGKQVLRGEIVKIDTAYSEQYGNITVTIKVGDKEIQCFRMKGDGAAALAVGDVITVTGIIKNFKGTVEFDAGCTFSKDLTVAEAKQLIVIEKAYELEQGKSMNGKQVLRGEIVKIDTAYSEQYGNITVTIQVGDKTIQCFRMKGEGAAALAVGDVITVTGIIKNFKGTVEFDAGCTFSKTQTIDEAKDVIVIEKAYELEQDKSMNGKQELTGAIVKIDTAYSEQYGNITVTIQVGEKTIQCFRMKGDGAAALAVGDVITVTGVIKNYKGTVEFDAGCTFVK